MKKIILASSMFLSICTYHKPMFIENYTYVYRNDDRTYMVDCMTLQADQLYVSFHDFYYMFKIINEKGVWTLPYLNAIDDFKSKRKEIIDLYNDHICLYNKKIYISFDFIENNKLDYRFLMDGDNENVIIIQKH